MIKTIDLNADMGEGFGPWRMGADEALLDVVTSANIACGYHAGDPDTMTATMAQALAKGVRIGAHPGLPDLQGFGRRRMQISLDEARHLVAYQVGAAAGIARMQGAGLQHVKLHGALANMAAEHEAMAAACFSGALAVDPGLILVVIAGTAQQRAAEAMGARFAAEIFADRAYDDTGLLLDRSKPGAVLHDPIQIAERVIAMVRAEAIQTVTGAWLPARIDTICLHGDGPDVTRIALTLRARLQAAGVSLKAFGL